MKIKRQMLVLLSVAMILLLVLSSVAYGQEERKIKMDEYKAELAGYQTREADANTKADALKADIAALKSEIQATQEAIDAEWAAIYAALGVTGADVNAYRDNLKSIEGQIDGLAGLSPEELFQKREEICALGKAIEEAKGSKIALLTEMEKKLADLDAKLANLKSKVPANIYDNYTVEKGDYLWKIAKKDDIYGDAYQWIRIYSVNKEMIKDPDLIYPEWVLKIARGVGMNEHLVVKGEWLEKIAGYAKVYNDPTKWTKLYEANKDLVSDPSLIYPHQVLQVPQD
jgi:nucleoid-associated protein YgaU